MLGGGGTAAHVSHSSGVILRPVGASVIGGSFTKYGVPSIVRKVHPQSLGLLLAAPAVPLFL